MARTATSAAARGATRMDRAARDGTSTAAHAEARIGARGPGSRRALAAALALVALGAPRAGAEPPANPEVVARISVEAPASEFFLLQATLPVPPNTYHPGDLVSPLRVRNPSGGLATTQVEAVTRYADDALGAEVVEVVARVRRPDVAPGTEVLFDVVREDHATGRFAATADVASLLSQPGAFHLRTRDLYGNRYACDLFKPVRTGVPHVVRLRDGHLVQEVRAHQVLRAAAGGGTGAAAPLPHHLAVHSVFRAYAGEDFLSLDLHVHNGMNGESDTHAWDDTLHHLYFDQLELHLPDGWVLLPNVEDPFFGDPFDAGGSRGWPIVEALPTGQLHVVPQQAHFWRRFVVAREGSDLDRARECVEGRFRGFCVDGVAPDGDPLWSWWSEETRAWMPQRHRLPQLEFVSPGALRDSYEAELAAVEHQMRTGDEGGYPFYSPVLGWAHPWGVPYGGMSGSDEIEQVPGVALAWSASQAGYRYHELRAGAYVDRQPVALYNANGTPTRIEQLVRPTGNYGPWMPTYFNLTPGGSSDHFGLESADDAHARAARARFLLPHYEKDLLDFQPIDLQHYARHSGNLLLLTWLGNDALARLELEHSAELFRLTFCEVYNSNYGHVQGAGLLSRVFDIDENPGQGANFGREVAWGMQTVLGAYMTGDDAFRARLYPWLQFVTRTARRGQSTCTGNTTSKRIHKEFKGYYQARQSFEANYFVNAMEGVRRAVFEGRDAVYESTVRDLIVDAAYATVSPPFWDPAVAAQHQVIAVRPTDNTAPEFCSQIPADGYDDENRYEWVSTMPPWAYAYRLTRDGIFLQRASEAHGNAPNLEAALNASGLEEIKNSAPLLSLLQEL